MKIEQDKKEKLVFALCLIIPVIIFLGYDYYKDSPSSVFWATTFYKKTESARREKIWKPKALLVKNIVQKFLGDQCKSIIDVGGGYGVFAEEIRGLLPAKTIVIEPAPHLATVCRKKGLLVNFKWT